MNKLYYVTVKEISVKEYESAVMNLEDLKRLQAVGNVKNWREATEEEIKAAIIL